MLTSSLRSIIVPLWLHYRQSTCDTLRVGEGVAVLQRTRSSCGFCFLVINQRECHDSGEEREEGHQEVEVAHDDVEINGRGRS